MKPDFYAIEGRNERSPSLQGIKTHNNTLSLTRKCKDMPGPVFLEGDEVTLRPIEEDIEHVQCWMNDVRV